jgi:hypothetical protein
MSRPLGKHKKILFSALYFVLLAGAFVVTAEVIVRLKTFKSWRKPDISVKVDPGGRFYQRHPVLGYRHIPGVFKVTPKNGVPFNVSHLPNTLRITQPLERYDRSRKKEEIWIFGCSFTHGWGLNDEETYSWRLQERLPQYEIVNFGVGGYGTIHSLLQFREALKLRTPKAVVLAYASFHDHRNTFLRSRRKQFAPWNKLGPLVQPYARLDERGYLRYLVEDVDSEPETILTMRRSALIDLIETLYYKYEDRSVDSHAVSEALVMEMARLAEKHNAKFVVAGINRNPGMLAMLEFARKNAIASFDISVDPNISANQLLNDSHPSAIATQTYADRLERILSAEIFKEHHDIPTGIQHGAAGLAHEP